MDAAVWGVVGVIVGGLITGFVTIRAESIRADKAAKLDSAKRQDDRRIASDAFQRENLLKLQEAIEEWIDKVIDQNDRETRSVRGGGSVDSDSSEPQAAIDDATRRMDVFAHRVRDDALRWAFWEMSGMYTHTRAELGDRGTDDPITEELLDAQVDALQEKESAVTIRLGEVLRELL